MARRAKKLWIAGGAIALAHNLTAEDGDTLSEAVDDWLQTHPVLTRATIALLALHLANAVAQRVDPVHWMFEVARSGRILGVTRRLGRRGRPVLGRARYRRRHADEFPRPTSYAMYRRPFPQPG